MIDLQFSLFVTNSPQHGGVISSRALHSKQGIFLPQFGKHQNPG